MIRTYEKQICKLVRENAFTYDTERVTSPDAAGMVARRHLEDLPEEHVIAITLDAKGDVVAIHEVSHGGKSQSMIEPADILKRVLLNNATSFILAHNHPSGDCMPSVEDIKVTERMTRAAEIVGCKMVDHIIVGSENYSFLKNGRM